MIYNYIFVYIIIFIIAMFTSINNYDLNKKYLRGVLKNGMDDVIKNIIDKSIETFDKNGTQYNKYFCDNNYLNQYFHKYFIDQNILEKKFIMTNNTILKNQYCIECKNNNCSNLIIKW